MEGNWIFVSSRQPAYVASSVLTKATQWDFLKNNSKKDLNIQNIYKGMNYSWIYSFTSLYKHGLDLYLTGLGRMLASIESCL